MVACEWLDRIPSFSPPPSFPLRCQFDMIVLAIGAKKARARVKKKEKVESRVMSCRDKMSCRDDREA